MVDLVRAAQTEVAGLVSRIRHPARSSFIASIGIGSLSRAVRRSLIKVHQQFEGLRTRSHHSGRFHGFARASKAGTASGEPFGGISIYPLVRSFLLGGRPPQSVRAFVAICRYNGQKTINMPGKWASWPEPVSTVPVSTGIGGFVPVRGSSPSIPSPERVLQWRWRVKFNSTRSNKERGLTWMKRSYPGTLRARLALRVLVAAQASPAPSGAGAQRRGLHHAGHEFAWHQVGD